MRPPMRQHRSVVLRIILAICLPYQKRSSNGQQRPNLSTVLGISTAASEAGSEVDTLRLCDLARGFADALEAHHLDKETGHLCTSADDARDVIFRSQPTIDDAVPNVHGLCVQALLKLASLTGETSMRNRADFDRKIYARCSFRSGHEVDIPQCPPRAINGPTLASDDNSVVG
jgi:hypothetical protein